jgi:hypothetical protein
MAFYPQQPIPSSVSAPAYIDPALRFVTDSGYETRRARHSRPRRRYTLDYNGMSVADMRLVTDFLQSVRFGTGETIQWFHPTAVETVPASNTTPIWLTFRHSMLTGQYIQIIAGPLAGAWRVTRVAQSAIALDGSTAIGPTTVSLVVYLPNAIARLADDVWESPTKLGGTDRLGPEQPGAPYGVIPGRFSFNVLLEEVF